MTGNKILIVEDDQILQDALKYNLEKEGYIVVTAGNGATAVEEARSNKPDLILLDIMLPVLDGLEVCRILRREMSIPILMLTAKADEVDKVVGLEIGADDYITKPFGVRELIARIRAALRRAEQIKISSSDHSQEDMITTGDLSINLASHSVKLAGKTVELSRMEFDLLAYLARNKRRVFSRDQLLEQIWGYDYSGNTRTVDVHIRWLRKKIEKDPDSPRYVVTVRGVGYKFEA